MKSKTSGDGTLMTRAFRGGIDNKKKVSAPTRIRNWNPIRDLRGLKIRTSTTGSEMGPLVDVPAMIRIENEHWVFERVEEGVLSNLTHRLIVHDSSGAKTIGATENMEVAMQVAQKMATLENKIVMIKPI
ncbi:MAG: hypothetical protein VX043_03240 [Candidatus Thermoplasmatota archaeon]|nr:hypothetical protein [Candidatus Thermoplasmatota archaeon]